MAEPIIVDGVCYDTLRDAARAYGKNLRDVNRRIKRGYSIEEAVKKPYKQTKIEVVMDGVRYSSVAAVGRAFGVDARRIHDGLRAGMSIEEAVFHAQWKPKRKKVVNVNGIEYSSITEAAIAFGKHRDTIYHRIKSGMTIEEALDQPVQHKRIITPLKIDGVVYETLIDAARAFEKNIETVRARLHKGMNVYEALTTPLIKTSVKYSVTLCGVTYESAAEAARVYNMSYPVILSRLRDGWTDEQAFGLIPPPRKHK